MLHVFLSTIFLLFTSSSEALEIQFIGACSPQPLLSQEIEFTSNLNVGEVSLKVLDENQIPYLGTTRGINQVFGSAIGLEAMEVISNTEMMAYGWCFEIDGVIPEVFADKVLIQPDTKVVSWFYGYAHFLNGEWVGQCLKSYLRRPTMYCP